MALAEVFLDLAQQMLTPGGIFENVPIVATYVRQDNPTYDPVTGVMTPNETTYQVAGVPDKVHYRAIDNVNVLADDRLFYIAGKVFTQAGLTLRSKPNDTLQLQGETWNVIRIDTDPVQAVYVIQVRRP